MSDPADGSEPTSSSMTTDEPSLAASINKAYYVPPHLRHRDAAAPPTDNSSSSSTTAPPEQYFTASAISQHYGTVHGGTINPYINDPRELAYILVFANQHPQYPPRIFVKSNLELVFENAAAGEEMNSFLVGGLEVPLFEEIEESARKRGGPSKREMRFRSWVRVKEVRRLVKGSDELVDMLVLKWQRDTPRRWRKAQVEDVREGVPEAAAVVGKEGGGGELVVENVVFKGDPEEEEEERERQRQLAPAPALGKEDGVQRLMNTAARKKSAWGRSLGFDWAIVTLEFVDSNRGNPMHGPPAALIPPAAGEEEAEGEKAEKEKVEEKKMGNKETEEEKAENEKTENEESEKEKTENEKTENEKTENEKTENEKTENEKTEKEDELLTSTESITLVTAPATLANTEDTVMVNDDLDSASIPSSPVVEPATPTKRSAVNLPAYSLSKSWENGHQRTLEKGSGAGASQEDISQSYISAGLAESVVDDFGAISAMEETDAEESDRWSELSEHERPEDEHWMAVERGGVAKEVY